MVTPAFPVAKLGAIISQALAKGKRLTEKILLNDKAFLSINVVGS
jgi:hypothetical protein